MTLAGLFWMIFSIFAALVLTILPLPMWAVWFRPEWLVLVVIYWCIALPHRVNVGIAWLLGLTLDGLSGTVLGEHALAMATVAYLAVKIHKQIRAASLWQQSLTICIFGAIFQVIVYLVQSMVGQVPSSTLYWMPTLTSIIFWPWIFIILRDWRRRFNIR